MLPLKRIIPLFCILLQSFAIHAQELKINGPWKVSFEDKPEFNNPALDDSKWEELSTLKWSDDHKTTANRTLWIRKKVVIPSSLKAGFQRTGLLALSMGKISQTDDTYLNGKAVGSTGSGDTYRNYLLGNDDILWDKENSIAIRVKHWGSFQVSKIPAINPAAPEFFFTYSSGLQSGDIKAPILKKDLVYQLNVANKSPKAATGTVTANFYNFEGVKLYTAEKNLDIAVGNNAVTFPYNAPSPFVKVIYTVAIPAYQYTREWNSEMGYQDLVYKTAAPVVAYKAPQKYFPAEQRKLKLGGWLGERVEANTEERLYKVDEKELLAGFINRPGSHSWIGEHIGKFLDAACNAYANNGDPALKTQIDRMAQQLIAAQLPDGYLGTYEMDSHWTSWDVWSHRYNLMGLLHYYEISGFGPALTASEKMGDLLIKTFGNGPGQKDIIKSGAHVGMAATSILESMAELYRFSGNKKYLDFCYYVINSYNNPGGPRILSTLDSAGRVDKVANAKAYEMMSNFLGIIKLYRITADEQFLKPLLLAWNDIAKNRLYITGTASSFEHFQNDEIFPAERTSNMGEGCVTTTWVQFNYQLFSITGQMKYLDELERSVYNHLTGAENPQTGCVSYYTPLMGAKPYGCGITCCMSSVPRGISMIPLFANGKLANNPSFLFYQPGTYTTSGPAKTPVTFTTLTDYLTDDDIKINVAADKPVQLAVSFRKPYWAKDFAIAVNGKVQAGTKTELQVINRLWKSGDVITIDFEMPVMVLDGGKSYPGQIALQRGPQVLAFDKNINGFDASAVAIDTKKVALETAANLPAKWVGGEAFGLKASVDNKEKNIVLVPYADASQTGGAMNTWLKKQN